MLSNEERCMYGEAAIQAGAPDHGQNGIDFEGVSTDAGDAIANILHRLYQANPADSLDEREQESLAVFDRAQRHFCAEIRNQEF